MKEEVIEGVPHVPVYKEWDEGITRMYSATSVISEERETISDNEEGMAILVKQYIEKSEGSYIEVGYKESVGGHCVTGNWINIYKVRYSHNLLL